MTRLGRFNGRCISQVAVVIAIAFAGPFFVVSAFRIRINFSPSLPLGLYRQTSNPQARLAEFCPEEPYARFAITREYRSSGNCPDGGAPLMKPIVAAAGDIVEISAIGIAVNGALLPNTAPKRIDREGRSLAHWPAGKYHVERGFMWVASSYNAWSYDSRYFGPIPTRSIRAHLKTLFVWR